MKKSKNIFSSLKLLIILLSAMFLLSACGESSDTKSPAEIAAEQRECWQAQTLSLLYNTMSVVTMTTYKNITNGAMSMMMVAFSIWFAMQMLKFVSSIAADGKAISGGFWTDVLKKFGLCFACGFLASSSEGLIYVLNMFLFPIFNAFLEFGSAIITEVGKTVNNLNASAFGESVTNNYPLTCSVENQNLGGASLEGFPQGANNMMQCMICALSEKMNLGFTISFTVMRAGYVVPKIVGFTLLCVFTFVKLGFVFYLVDTIFKFTMMLVFLPLFIMGWAFDVTKGWTKKAIPIMLHSAAFMLAMSIILAMTILAIVRVIQQNPALFGPDSDWAFREFSPPLLVLLMIAFLVKSSMGIAGKIAKIISGTSIESKFQEKLGMILRLVAQGIGSIISIGSLAPVFMKINTIKKIVDKAKKLKEATDKIKDKIDKLSGKSGDKEEEDGKEDKTDE